MGGSQTGGGIAIGIVDTGDFHLTDVVCLRGEPAGDASAADNADADVGVLLLAQHGRRDSFRPREIDYVAEFTEIIEVSLPV